MNPTPGEVKAARQAAGLTQTQAAAVVHVGLRAWQQWEAGSRAMHPAMWELFCIKVERKQLTTSPVGTQKPQNVDDKPAAWLIQNGDFLTFTIYEYETLALEDGCIITPVYTRKAGNVDDKTKLHAAIMNIPANCPIAGINALLAYKLGHKDARHAAADLVNSIP